MITSTDYAGRACTLTFKGQPVAENDLIDDFRGKSARIIGGEAPHKPASSGKIYTNHGHYYPSVFGCEWTPTNKG